MEGMLVLLPLLAFAMSPDGSASGVVVTTPHAAQARLAEALGDADSIDWVTVDRAHHRVTFAIDRAGEAYEIIATTRPSGTVVSLAIRDLGLGHVGMGSLSWLADAMQDTAAVSRLLVDEDGAVTLVTSEGARLMAIPGRGSGGNAAVEARWAAAWNNG